VKFAGGAVSALGIHEGAHLVFDGLWHARPGLKKVDFLGVPFFAITHRPVSRRREFVIASAGFWTQHATSEWLLARHADLRAQGGSLEKGMFAFNVLTSAGYASAAAFHAGPPERDTRAMADSLRADERWVAALVLAPAALDAWRYFHPDAGWARWSSRGVKIALVLLVAR
jgi:hypothetical protein